jgi:SAM-dependent methyltransferase
MGIYEKYAEVYDNSGQIWFSLKMIPYLQRLLELHPVRKGRMLDLACGTGTVALSFATEGWETWGVDASPEMLAVAEQKSHESEQRLRLSCQDIRRFTVPPGLDLITCLYDSLNYILSIADLEAVFRRVREHLAPGGLFFFDMNTAWALEYVWDHRTLFTEGDDLSLVLDSEYDRDTLLSKVTVTGFVRRGDLYERFSETHLERAYSESQIQSALDASGLNLVAHYDCFALEFPDEESTRIMWVAARAGG